MYQKNAPIMFASLSIRCWISSIRKILSSWLICSYCVCDSDRNCSCAGLGTREALSGLFWLLKLKMWHMIVEWELQLVELEQISYCPSLLLFHVCCHQFPVLPWRSIIYLPFNLCFTGGKWIFSNRVFGNLISALYKCGFLVERGNR